MGQGYRRDATWLQRVICFPSLKEFVFSLNVVAAFGYALLTYTIKSLTSWVPATDVGYYFLRAAVRTNDLLFFRRINAVTTGAVGRRDQLSSGRFGEECAILISVVGVSVLGLLLLKLVFKSPAVRSAFNRLFFLTVVFAPPACYLYMSKVTWLWNPTPVISTPEYPFWRSPLLAVFVGQIVCVGILYLIHQSHPIPVWLVGVFLVIHYVFWMPVLWLSCPTWTNRLVAPFLLLGILPLSGAVWLLCFKGHLAENPAHSKKADKWDLVAAAVSLAILLLIWHPGRAYSLTLPKDLKSVTIEISRGPCFGSCGSYRLVIHGSGLLEYDGYSDVRVHGKQSASIGGEQVVQLLEKLDRIHFFAIEDRAFRWCFDTPSVSVSVSVDGRTKQVVSDAGCTRANGGVQDQFVQVSHQIDDITGSDRWVRCDRRFCPY